MISVIIPVYNEEKFLRRCLESVANQTDKTAQVILVNDGSTDGSGDICDEYARKNGWEVYHTKNGGVSKARNYGLDKAKGDYVTFLDADDFLAKDAIEIMKRYTKPEYNIVQFNQYRLWNTVNFDERLLYPFRSPEGRYNLDNLFKHWVHVWNKMYKLDFLKEHNITFKEGMQFGEDAIFSAQYLLANNGLYHAKEATVYHILDDKNSLCRGDGLNLNRLELLDTELCKLYDKQTLPAKKRWVMLAINQHRHSRLFRKFGFNKGFKGNYDVVYVIKDSSMNPELVYSLRSVENNWQYKNVWFCGGCPERIKPDHHMKIEQTGVNKWEKVRNMVIEICKNDQITDNFWLFNDDFFVLKKIPENMPAQYNGRLIDYVERIEKRRGGPDGFTVRLRQAAEDLKEAGLDTLNYEVHKPMLFNRKKLLEALEKFPNTPAYRSIYGNYWKIGGQTKHDMKIKVLKFSRMYNVESLWEFVSTSDVSFRDGNVGEFIRNKFKDKSRFEI